MKLLGIFDSFFDSSNNLKVKPHLINNFTIVFVPKIIIFIELVNQKIFRIKFVLVGLDKNIWLSKLKEVVFYLPYSYSKLELQKNNYRLFFDSGKDVFVGSDSFKDEMNGFVNLFLYKL
ncbi:MAG: hypothetical protein HC932_01660 [Thermales bacterium]|nr:hypothetical protein [Thermales bacterium]